MHKNSIVQTLLNQWKEHARANDTERITKIEVKIGMEPHLLETAFNTFKEKTLCDSAEFVMRIQPVVIYCNECEEDFTLGEHDYSCPKCRGNLVKILDGEDMLLMRLEMI